MEAEKKRFHSVRLEKDKCRGCTNCLKRCKCIINGIFTIIIHMIIGKLYYIYSK